MPPDIVKHSESVGSGCLKTQRVDQGLHRSAWLGLLDRLKKSLRELRLVDGQLANRAPTLQQANVPANEVCAANPLAPREPSSPICNDRCRPTAKPGTSLTLDDAGRATAKGGRQSLARLSSRQLLLEFEAA